MPAHVVQREQALFLDRLADGALGDTVAAADLVAVGHGGRTRVALVAGVADVVLAEHQPVADVGHRAALAHQLEVPAAVRGVAVQAGADEAVALDDELLVDPAPRVVEHDLLGARAAGEVAGREQVDAGDLELGAGGAAGVAADAELRQVRGTHLGLLEQRGHQAVGHAAVRRAFAHRIDARVGHGLQRVGDDHAALAQKAGALGQRRAGPDARGHHHQVGRDLAPVLEAHRHYAAVAVGQQGLGVRADLEADAALLQRPLQQPASGLVELALHQPRHDVDDGDLHAAPHQAVGGFQPEQAAADDHGLAVLLRGVDHGLCVGDVAVSHHAGQVAPRHGQDERVGTGGQQQSVVRGLRAVVSHHDAAHAVHLHHAAASVQRDAVLGVPGQRVEHDLVDRLLARQHGAEQDAVVVRVRLGAEHGDVVELRREGQQLLHGADAGHAVAHHHESLPQRGAVVALHAAAFSGWPWRV
jgi:hypothetical protein